MIAYALYNDYKHNEILENKKETIGVITKYQYSNYVYSLYYEFLVDNIKYKNAISVKFFKCDDGTKGCKGKEFPVYYSSKDPNNSMIDLGKYNKFK